jgi:hypothetical protein
MSAASTAPRRHCPPQSRVARRENGRGLVLSLTLARAPSTDAVGRHMPGAICAGDRLVPTRIAVTELGARHRRARFPAAPRVASLLGTGADSASGAQLLQSERRS